MENLKHTKGAWVLSHGANTYSTIGSAELHQPIATIHKIENVKSFCEEAEANAKLIASAPELFEALIWAKEQFKILADKGQYPEHLLTQNGGDGIMKIENAINKATKL